MRFTLVRVLRERPSKKEESVGKVSSPLSLNESVKGKRERESRAVVTMPTVRDRREMYVLIICTTERS